MASVGVTSTATQGSDSMSMTVKDLAAEGRADTAKSKLPAVPVYIVVLGLVVVALAIVTVPLGLIISDSSQTTITDLSQLVTRQAVDGIYDQVQNVLDEPRKLLSIVVSNEHVEKVVTTNNANLRGESEMFAFFQTLINSTAYVNVISCVTWPNLFPGGNTNDPWPNATYMVSFRQGSNFVRYIMDCDNVARLLPTQIEAYQRMMNYPTNTDFKYSYGYTSAFLASVIVGSKWLPALTPTHVTYGCSVGFDNRASLDPLLLSIKVTADTHVFLMDAATGTLLSNSVLHSTFKLTNESDSTSRVLPLTPDTTNDTSTHDLGTFLKNKFGNYSLIPNEGKTVSIETTIAGTRWILNYRYLERPDNWIVVVGIPRSDFFSKTDKAQEKAAILASCLSVVGIILTVVFAWLAMRPLHTLTLAMEKLTKLDFSALEGDVLNDRSFMLEVRRLQVTFALMCKAFASGIRKNKSLVSPSDRRTSSGAQSETQTSVRESVSRLLAPWDFEMTKGDSLTVTVKDLASEGKVEVKRVLGVVTLPVRNLTPFATLEDPLARL
ncbi:hypothetical protein HDU76_010411 [Blyttiomyces sp. JEL0837]|nr:hypothetical protein HDU76_010411 [Blyttiomyces sp. JEL0837]